MCGHPLECHDSTGQRDCCAPRPGGDCYRCGGLLGDAPAIIGFGIDPDTGYHDEICLCAACDEETRARAVDAVCRCGSC